MVEDCREGFCDVQLLGDGKNSIRWSGNVRTRATESREVERQADVINGLERRNKHKNTPLAVAPA